MLRHYNRSAANCGNKDIDHSLSDLNYNLAPYKGIEDFDYYKKRLSQVKCQNRADVKTLCDWVITLPKETFTEKEERLFFQSVYEFMAKRYKEENVVSAWVHKDEAGQPHMHFCFIPICVDKKKNIEKVSAKEVINRNELRMIHKEVSEHMKRTFGRDIGILNGATAGGNRTVMELKTQDLQREVEVLTSIKKQSIIEMAQTIKKMPGILSDINRAVRIALGKEKPPTEKEYSRSYERSR